MQMSASALAKQNNEFILYRLNAIERRMDYIESQLKGQDKPELIQLMVELIKGQNHTQIQQHTESHDSEPSPVKPTTKHDTNLESFSMARRRSVV